MIPVTSQSPHKQPLPASWFRQRGACTLNDNTENMDIAEHKQVSIVGIAVRQIDLITFCVPKDDRTPLPSIRESLEH